MVGRSSVVLVECNKDNIKVRFDAGGGKEAAEPLPSKRDVGIMTIVVDIGLIKDQVSGWVSSWISTHRVPGKCWQRLLGNIGAKLTRIDDTSTTCRILLNIRVANEWVVFSARKVINVKKCIK